MAHLAAALCVAFLAVGTIASAQTPATGRPSPLDAAAVSRPTVQILIAGQTQSITGTLLSADATFVDVVVDGAPRRLELSTVDRIVRRGDRLTNGFLIGFGALGAWCAYVCGQGTGPGLRLAAAVGVNGLLGGAVGAWFDASHTGTTTLYRRPSTRVQATVSDRAVRLSIRF